MQEIKPPAQPSVEGKGLVGVLVKLPQVLHTLQEGNSAISSYNPESKFIHRRIICTILSIISLFSR